MIIILPFVTALVACIEAMRGRRRAALAWWLMTLVVNLGWLWYHMTDKLNLNF